MQNLIIGTIGHIDHGKTSLIEAINGFWGDRRKEEQERGITLDLSFSNCLSNNKNISFIDVPGHEKLVKHMIAGAFGMDYCLLVVAANEGLKPQSIEHIKIAKLLGVSSFIVVFTKCDLEDIDTTNATNEILELISPLKIFHTSIHDKKSIESLKNYLFSLPNKIHRNLDVFRYYIDRVFTLKGIGCVVSGTLLDGRLALEDKIWCCNLNRALNIKNIQNHGEYLKVANIGERVAINLSGVSHNELKRGDLLTKKGYFRGFDTLEVSIELFSDVAHNSDVIFYIGALKCNARILFLDDSKKYATIKTQQKIFAIFGERFIIRDDNVTLGGGSILGAIADPMKKSQKLHFVKLLDKRDFKNAFFLLLEVHKKGFGLLSATQRFAISKEEALSIANTLENCYVDSLNLVVYPKSSIDVVLGYIKEILHKNKKALLSSTLLTQKYSWVSENLATLALECAISDKLVVQKESFFVSPSFNDSVHSYVYNEIYSMLLTQEYEPLAPYNIYDVLDIDRKIGDDALKILTKEKKVLRLSHKLFITSSALSKLLEEMRSIIKNEGYLDINNFKRHFPLSRKYLITYLDYLDSFSDIINTNGTRTLKDS